MGDVIYSMERGSEFELQILSFNQASCTFVGLRWYKGNLDSRRWNFRRAADTSRRLHSSWSLIGPLITKTCMSFHRPNILLRSGDPRSHQSALIAGSLARLMKRTRAVNGSCLAKVVLKTLGFFKVSPWPQTTAVFFQVSTSHLTVSEPPIL